MEERIEERLEKAAVQIVPDRAAQERILEGIRIGKHSRKRLSLRVPAAVLAVCVVAGLLWFSGVQNLMGEEIVVYAATEEHGWQKLKEGERIQLKKEPFMTIEEGEDIEVYDEYGWCVYYPYKCIFRIEVPEDHVYVSQMVLIRDDSIHEQGDRIEWRVAPDRPEDAGRVMQGAFRIWIVNDNFVNHIRERVAALELELTKEDGKCYAELKRVWESSGYEE